ncbi:hypothetical protein NHX12_017118 [Muraenolepis orangiensis]|uniref:Uncharacterized protein n=1 Tax=Muraenolepis orangiensis TaxID=630683 RepID=A0A9Q0D7A4_9TELE|nr:hypothetical protein NHX12_017118 [Muraenolepis orangiensis]
MTESIPFELDFTPGRSNTGTDLSRASGGRGLETLCLDGTLATLRLDIQGTSSSPNTGCVMKRGESVAFITRDGPGGAGERLSYRRTWWSWRETPPIDGPGGAGERLSPIDGPGGAGERLSPIDGPGGAGERLSYRRTWWSWRETLSYRRTWWSWRETLL